MQVKRMEMEARSFSAERSRTLLVKVGSLGPCSVVRCNLMRSRGLFCPFCLQPVHEWTVVPLHKLHPQGGLRVLSVQGRGNRLQPCWLSCAGAGVQGGCGEAALQRTGGGRG